jgi:hypothetical protein
MPWIGALDLPIQAKSHTDFWARGSGWVGLAGFSGNNYRLAEQLRAATHASHRLQDVRECVRVL